MCKARYGFCDRGRKTEFSRRELLTQGLHNAIEQGGFTLRYQPQVMAPTGQIFGAEALLRWEHPILGSVGPDEFIPLAEQTGLIIPIGTWVLKEACRQAARWSEQGWPLKMSVNVASQQLADPAFADIVLSALAEAGLPADRLEIELTERVMMSGESNPVLNAIRQSGVHVAIDDFGTGYSSLNYLSRFPANVLKIDKSFIDNVSVNDKDGSVVRTILNIGRELGMTVIAEGVENTQQADFLVQNRCDAAQGYFYYRPIAPNDFSTLLASKPGGMEPGALVCHLRDEPEPAPEAARRIRAKR